MAKPKTKQESWAYTVTKSKSRKKVSRARNKARRRVERKGIYDSVDVG